MLHVRRPWEQLHVRTNRLRDAHMAAQSPRHLVHGFRPGHCPALHLRPPGHLLCWTIEKGVSLHPVSEQLDTWGGCTARPQCVLSRCRTRACAPSPCNGPCAPLLLVAAGSKSRCSACELSTSAPTYACVHLSRLSPAAHRVCCGRRCARVSAPEHCQSWRVQPRVWAGALVLGMAWLRGCTPQVVSRRHPLRVPLLRLPV